eukprot:jgi/Ulvmu1/6488/UM003_0120.1
MQAADALADQKTLHVLCTALRRPMHHALGLEMPAPLRGSTLACDVLPAGDADRFTPAWAAEVRTPLSRSHALRMCMSAYSCVHMHALLFAAAPLAAAGEVSMLAASVQ